ncbi:type II toxin-antitoxin system RelB family antitoxin (plasmid) [Eubacteriales bacterium KG127]
MTQLTKCITIEIRGKGDKFMSIVSLRLNENEKNMLERVSAMYGCGLSSMIKKIVFERLEDEYDLKVIQEYEKSKEDGTLELMDSNDVWKELGL